MHEQKQVRLLTPQTYTIDTALSHVGGFGYFQYLALITLTLLRSSGMYLYYAFGFLTLEQSYLCKDSSGMFT